MRFFIFIVITQAIIGLCHYLVYKTAVHALPLTENGRFWLGVSLVVLSVLFFTSTILTMKFSGLIISTIYTIGAFWLGTLFFLFVATVIISLVVLINSRIGFTLPVNWISAGLFALAVIMSFYAAWNGTRIQRTTIEVEILNLPSLWDGKKIAFFADSHFGNLKNIGLAKQISKVITEEKPELVLIGGDIFDGPKIDSNKTAQAMAGFSKTIPTYFVTGNHEYYGAKAEFLKSLVDVADMKLLDDSKVLIDGLAIVGLDYQNTTTTEGTKAALKKAVVVPTEPTIIVKHVPLNLEPLEESGASLSLFGHTHRGQLFPFSLLTKRIYKGFDYGLKKFGAMSVYTTSGAGTWGPPQRLGTQSEIVFITLKQKAVNHFASYHGDTSLHVSQ